jgi:hypothetical protein
MAIDRVASTVYAAPPAAQLPALLALRLLSPPPSLTNFLPHR